MADAVQAGLEPQLFWPGSPGLYKPLGKVEKVWGQLVRVRGVRSSWGE